jgi:hypothetical protein
MSSIGGDAVTQRFDSMGIEEVEGKRQVASKRREAMATSPPFFFSNEGSLSEKKAALGG